MNNRVLYLGLNHRKDDPRLTYRQIRLLVKQIPSIEILMCTKRVVDNERWHITSYVENMMLDGSSIKNIIIEYSDTKHCNLIKKIFAKIKVAIYIIKTGKIFNVDIIQASHVFELFVALIIAKASKAKTVYDSHEDYLRMAIDYSDHTLKSWFTAFVVIVYELVLIRFYDIVFCTDEFLFSKYMKKYYGAKEVHLLRNYPYLNIETIDKTFNNKNVLKLVYVGGVNVYRGVIECANYVKEYNNNHTRKLSLDLYSPENEIVNKLVQEKLVNYFGWVDYKELMIRLSYSYDIGVCLLLPIKKYYRNLPLKNFDYMGAGLPIITSNFGNLKHHMDRSKAGICIDPLNYNEFKVAIEKMFDPEVRKYYSENGLKFVKYEASFQVEGTIYLEYFKSVLSTDKY